MHVTSALFASQRSCELLGKDFPMSKSKPKSDSEKSYTHVKTLIRSPAKVSVGGLMLLSILPE